MSKQTIRNLKYAGAVLLLLAFFLPLSRCDESSWQVYEAEQAGLPTDNIGPSYEYFYAWEVFTPDGVNDFQPLLAILVVLAFTWPLLFLFTRPRIKNDKINTGLLFFEPLIAAGGAYFVFIINVLNELYIGFYVAMAGVLLFFLGAVTEIVIFLKQRKVK